MAKYYGEIGYADPSQVETAPGVWEDVIIEKKAYGDVLRNNRRLNPGENANNEISVGNTISIVADAYAQEHFFAIRYVRWAGTLWTVSTVDVVAPRLNMTLGGVYNGPKAGSTNPT
jgi:hypothetical protein|tara:strand:+ start:125 stop:472 length:348 start_codon:yes stop_codon:yes gene_type:complete